jgi:hypothetical protein
MKMIIEVQERKSGRSSLVWLLLIMALAFLSRAAALWWTRPEFMGWFNHAPWYWVQTRGLLQNGVLPFPDLPLLFHRYAGVAGPLAQPSCMLCSAGNAKSKLLEVFG